MSLLLTRLFVTGAALLLFATAAFATGEYQRTKDGKTTVWNSAPKAGDTAAWVGDRDREGYATGFGTLTWYTGKGNVFGRYYGNMIRGKLDGAVNVHLKGKTAHAFFTDGTRTSRWAMGPAPSRRLPPEQRAIREEHMASAPPRKEKTESSAATPKPETPAEAPAKPPTVAKTEKPKAPEPVSTPPPEASPPAETTTTEMAEATPEKESVASQPANPEIPAEPPPPTPPSQPSPSKKSPAEVEASLQSLVRPPSVLHENPETGGTSPADAKPPASSSGASEARLTREEVIETADALARKRGYDPGDYERAEPQYNSSDRVWSLSYDQKSSSSEEPARHFSVTVDDHTKGTIFVAPK